MNIQTELEKKEIIEILNGNNYSDYLKIVSPIMKKSLNYLIHVYNIDEMEAEDLIEDGILKAIKKIETFDENKGSFSTWVFVIILNCARDFLKKPKMNYLHIEELEEKGFQASNNEQFTGDNLVKDNKVSNKTIEFILAMKNLSATDQEVINIVMEDISSKKAGQLLHISEDAYRKRKERALLHFKERLVQYSEFKQFNNN